MSHLADFHYPALKRKIIRVTNLRAVSIGVKQWKLLSELHCLDVSPILLFFSDMLLLFFCHSHSLPKFTNICQEPIISNQCLFGCLIFLIVNGSLRFHFSSASPLVHYLGRWTPDTNVMNQSYTIHHVS